MKMKIITIRFTDIDDDDYGWTEVYKAPDSFDFEKFYNDVEKYHEETYGDYGFEGSISRVAKKHGLKTVHTEEYTYEY